MVAEARPDAAPDAHVPIDGAGFHHPYAPYAIQLDFMRALYRVLDDGKIGIFESPTGTGKTLSLICGALTWLRHRAEKDGGLLDPEAEDAQTPDTKLQKDDDDEPAWVKEQAEADRLQTRLARALELDHKLSEIRKREAIRHKKQAAHARMVKRLKTDTSPVITEDDFLLLDNDAASTDLADGQSAFSPEVARLLAQMGHASVAKAAEDADYPNTRKIIFASRTHSQLSQFSSELRRVPIRRVAAADDDDDDAVRTKDSTHCDARSVALASRKNLCIHPAVSRLPAEALNETCLELQESKTSTARKCPYLPKEDAKKHAFRDRALADIKDIEELVELGKQLEVCPYYATRLAIPASEVVTVPYPLLLNPTARAALSLDLRGNVIVIDEAHNLIDAVSSTFGASVSVAQLERARDALQLYEDRFKSRLSGDNRMHVAQLRILVRSLLTFVNDPVRAEGQVRVGDLLAAGGDTINIHAISRYLTNSKLARKVDGYAKFRTESGAAEKRLAPSTPVLHILQSFLERVANPSSEGSFLLEVPAPASSSADGEHNGTRRLRYLLLDPSHAFLPLVQEAHAVVLAGGTMSPQGEHVDRLFPTQRDRVVQFSCGHVVPADHLCVRTLVSGPSGKVALDFRHSTRNDPAVVDELGRALNNLAAVVPDGLVVFFPSYSHMAAVVQRWRTTGAYAALDAKKALFVEARGTDAEAAFAAYSAAILASPAAPSSAVRGDSGGSTRSKGAALLAVLGGKLSEGINFSDRLGRCVAVVGLPFPDARSAEWRARLDFVASNNSSSAAAAGDAGSAASAPSSSSALATATATATAAVGSDGTQQRRADGSAARKEDAARIKGNYMTDIAMRSVNQAIGRVLRHKDDHAAIVLCDSRWAMTSGLPPPTIASTASRAPAAADASAAAVAEEIRSRHPLVSRLPRWIAASLPTPAPIPAIPGTTTATTTREPAFGETVAALARFYKARRANNC